MNRIDYEKSRAKYRFLDYFRQEYCEINCLVIESNEKTSVIALLDFGPRGRKPGDTMRVHNKSIIWQKKETVPDWHAWTD